MKLFFAITVGLFLMITALVIIYNEMNKVDNERIVMDSKIYDEASVNSSQVQTCECSLYGQEPTGWEKVENVYKEGTPGCTYACAKKGDGKEVCVSCCPIEKLP